MNPAKKGCGSPGRLRIAGIMRHVLSEGSTVEMDGLGVFEPREGGGVTFVPSSKPKIFLAYVEEDLPAVKRLYEGFRARGFDPWLDKEKLLPGQNWPRAIERSIRVADFFIACFSRRALSKRGCFQSELRYALDCASRLPLEDVYFIPLRLEECDVPDSIARQTQYADLFPEWDAGFERVVESIERQSRLRPCEDLRLAG